MSVTATLQTPPVELVLSLLQKVKGTDNGWTALCPAHDDRHPSLSITIGDDDRVLLNCHAGCTIDAICNALHLEPKDLFPVNNGGRQIVATYVYTDEEEQPLFEVVRFQPKDFRQRRPDGSWGLGNTRRVLFRLPYIFAAIERNEPIYIVEGEKDVLAIEAAGGTATCSPMGAGKWRDEYAESLTDAQEVIIVADKDTAGLEHALQIERSLQGRVDSIIIVEAAQGKDVADHLAAGLPLGDLLPRIGVSAIDEPFRLTVRTAIEIEATPDPPDSDRLLGPFVTKGERTILVGDTGHGKTTLALQIIRAILSGDEMIGHDGAGTGPAMIVDLEQGRRAIKRGLREAHLHERDDVLHISVPDGLALDKDHEHIAELNRVIAEHQPVVLLLDPYYKAHRADDPNQERPIIDLMRQLDSLRTQHGFALLLPAHPRKEIAGKEGSRKLTLHDISGSGAVVRGAEIVLGLERLAHGYARLRYLKDREGDLPVGDAIALLYDKDGGYRLDPRDDESDEAIEARILATNNDWMTAPEWQKELGIRKARAVAILGQMAEAGRIAYLLGPPGRSKSARCYGTSPTTWEQSGTLGTPRQIPIESETGPGGPPPVRGDHNRDQSNDADNWSGTTTDPDDDIPF